MSPSLHQPLEFASPEISSSSRNEKMNIIDLIERELALVENILRDPFSLDLDMFFVNN